MTSCDETRRTLWPLDRPREAAEDEAEAREHLDACPACRAFFARDAAVSRAIAARGIPVAAPEALRLRLRELLASSPAPGAATAARRRPRATRQAVRALPWVAAAVFAGLAVGLARTDSNLEGMYAQDFVARTVETPAVQQPDVQAVSAYFMRELGVSVAPVVLDASPLRRATICVIDGKRAALVEYEIDGYAVAHYRVPMTGAGPRRPRAPGATDENGVCVYRWSDTRFEHALVSTMPEDRLVALAEASFHAAP
ncbi:MAG: hypothetical protein R3195_13345 [Gemmatimonadota bacterium]|nr:hypothetical protein [Gemmatimonadota bacterium]